MVDNSDAKANLITLGLHENEASVYLELLRTGKQGMLPLSRKLDIPRTNIYRLCESLVDKRFAQWVVDENGKKVEALDPASLRSIVKDAQNQVEKIEKSVENLIDSVKSLNSSVGTQVRYYSGKDGLKQMIWNCLKAESEIVGWSVYGRGDVVGYDFIEKYANEFRLKGLSDRAIANVESMDHLKSVLPVINSNSHQQTYNDIRIVPKETFYISGDTSIYNNIFAVGFWREGEIVGVEIENAEIAKVQKSIFEVLWKMGKPVEEFL